MLPKNVVWQPLLALPKRFRSVLVPAMLPLQSALRYHVSVAVSAAVPGTALREAPVTAVQELSSGMQC